MKSGFLLNVVIGQSTAIFQLLSSENQSLLIRRDSFFILDFLFDILDGIGGFHIQSDGLAGESLDCMDRKANMDQLWEQWIEMSPMLFVLWRAPLTRGTPSLSPYKTKNQTQIFDIPKICILDKSVSPKVSVQKKTRVSTHTKWICVSCGIKWSS